MNKNVKIGLIVVGVVVGLRVIGYAAYKYSKHVEETES